MEIIDPIFFLCDSSHVRVCSDGACANAFTNSGTDTRNNRNRISSLPPAIIFHE